MWKSTFDCDCSEREKETLHLDCLSSLLLARSKQNEKSLALTVLSNSLVSTIFWLDRLRFQNSHVQIICDFKFWIEVQFKMKLPLGALRTTYKALLIIAITIIHMKNLLTTREANFHSSRSICALSSSRYLWLSKKSFSVSRDRSSRLWPVISSVVCVWEGSEISGIQFTTAPLVMMSFAENFCFISICFLFSCIMIHSCCMRTNFTPHSHNEVRIQRGSGTAVWWYKVRTTQEKTKDIKIFNMVSP